MWRHTDRYHVVVGSNVCDLVWVLTVLVVMCVGKDDLKEKTLEELIKLSEDDAAQTGIFNNAAQVWNHTFYWKGMKPGGSTPSDAVAKALTDAFGSVDKFKELFSTASAKAFGSAWVWLAVDADKQLKILDTGNAGVTFGKLNATPILTLDVWEHAYYLAFQNRRVDYIKNFWSVVNWQFVEDNLKAAGVL